MYETRYNRQQPSFSISECVSLQQWATSGNRFKNVDNFATMLSKFTLISRLKQSKLKFREFIYNLKVVKYNAGDTIYNKDTDERSFNLILQGNVGVYGHEHEGLKDTEATYIKSLHHNSYFGHCVALDNIEIQYIVAETLTFICQLNLKNMYKILDGILVFPELTEEYNFFKKIVLFKDLDKRRVLKMIEANERKEHLIDTVIYHEGSQPQYLFVIETGEVELFKNNGKQQIPVATLTKFQLLGIEEILNNRRYEYTAKARDQTNIIIQIPKQSILEVLDQVPLQTNVYEAKEKLRSSRLRSAISSLDTKKQEQRKRDRENSKRASFREKRRFYTEPSANSREDSRLEVIRKTSYLTNKNEPFFQNEEDFYQSKIIRLEAIVQNRYGSTYQQKFFDLFEGYDHNRKGKMQRNKLKSKYFLSSTKKNSSNISTNISTQAKWNHRTQLTQARDRSTNFVMRQLNKKFLDIEDCERRLQKRFLQF